MNTTSSLLPKWAEVGSYGRRDPRVDRAAEIAELYAAMFSDDARAPKWAEMLLTEILYSTGCEQEEYLPGAPKGYGNGWSFEPYTRPDDKDDPLVDRIIEAYGGYATVSTKTKSGTRERKYNLCLPKSRQRLREYQEDGDDYVFVLWLTRHIRWLTDIETQWAGRHDLPPWEDVLWDDEDDNDPPYEEEDEERWDPQVPWPTYYSIAEEGALRLIDWCAKAFANTNRDRQMPSRVGIMVAAALEAWYAGRSFKECASIGRKADPTARHVEYAEPWEHDWMV